LQILEISVFVGFAGDPSPDARNHGLAPQPDLERTQKEFWQEGGMTATLENLSY
jgi:hypothetical protein